MADGEKTLIYLRVESHSFAVKVKRTRKNVALLVFATLLLAASLGLIPGRTFDTGPDARRRPAPARKEFKWEDIKPSPSLEYYDCFARFQCARLEVPLDWNSTARDGGPKAAIAIMKLPGKVEVTDPRYGGAILFNPGGPGGSGVRLLSGRADQLQTVVDSALPVNETEGSTTEKYFDLMSWDPRAVNNTTPHLVAIEDQLSRQAFSDEKETVGNTLADLNIFTSAWSRMRAFGRRVATIEGTGELEGVGPLAQYVSTANVIRDMVEIIERHGQWRERRAKSLLSRCGSPIEQEAVLHRTTWHKGEEKLQFWGFSYGTYVAQTFASMQPHRVHRIVSDGNVNADEYAANNWAIDLIDDDKITSTFAASCHTAGPEKCALYDLRGPDQILVNFHTILKDLKENPITTFSPDGTFTTLDHSQAIDFIISSWYNPLQGFKQVADLLASAAKGNISVYASGKQSFTCDLPTRPAYDLEAASASIICTDGDTNILHETASSYYAGIKNYTAVNSLFGEVWAFILLQCTSLATRAKWRFPGPFGAETAHPILFASQSLDPVCPLRNAVDAQTKFPGSVVIEAKGAGHCSVAMPSVCTFNAIKKYFQTGELPEGPLKRCDVDVEPFGIESTRVKSYDQGDRALLEAAKQLADMEPFHRHIAGSLRRI